MKTTIKTTAITIAMLFIALIATTNTVKAQETSEKTYIKIVVDGLSCPFCAYGLEKKLKKVKSAEHVLIEVTTGEITMSVPTIQKPSEDELRKVVKDAGFTPREITFSETPFETKKDE